VPSVVEVVVQERLAGTSDDTERALYRPGSPRLVLAEEFII
jgi:hypothetical protein